MTTGMVVTLPQTLLRLLPHDVARVLGQLAAPLCAALSEIRLRVDRPLELVGVAEYEQVTIREQHVHHVLATVTGSSLHAVEADLRAGFLTAPGGHRIGLAGRIVIGEDGRIKTMRDISSLNIRVASQAYDCALALAPYLVDERGQLQSTVLVGPPLSGKTTLLRDACRLLGSGRLHPRLARKRVVIVDERSEIAGCVHGVPQFDVGLATDVLDSCPKVEGLYMALRALGPQVLVTDELAGRADTEAVIEAAHSGVCFLGSLHGDHVADLRSRPALSWLMKADAVSRIIFLDARKGPGSVGRVVDGAGREVTRGWP